MLEARAKSNHRVTGSEIFKHFNKAATELEIKYGAFFSGTAPCDYVTSASLKPALEFGLLGILHLSWNC